MSSDERPRIAPYRRHLLICTGTRCAADGGAEALLDGLGAQLDAAGLQDGPLRVKRSRVSCFAACRGGPLMAVQPDGVWYCHVTPENMERIIERHLLHGEVVEDLVFHRGPGAIDPD
mgnify:CR=1 FL=1